MVLALVDTGASLSLLRGDRAREIMYKRGRPFILTKCNLALVTLSGDRLNVEGCLEALVPEVGLVKFVVVKNMAHEAILGWDQMSRYGWSLDSTNEMMKWGSTYFSIVSPTDAYEAAVIDAGCLTDIISKHRKVFGEAGKLPVADLPQVTITTEAGALVAQRPYRTALAKRTIIETEIDKMLELGIIRPSQSPWASPVCLVPKKDGTTRFCIDYRQLNAVTVKDRYPLPLIQDIFDQLGGSKLYSSLDMRSGYWQLPMAEASIEKTAFVCHRGQFEFVRLPFGLANAPSVYQRAMNKVLGKFIGKFVMVFIDDIVIYSKNKHDHRRHVEQVLQTLADAGLTLKDSKCHWAQTKIDLLGYVVSAQGVSAQSSKTSAIKALAPPNDVSELRRFLGMTGYYRQLIPEYARKATALYALTRKDATWQWNEAETQGFESLRQALCESTVMAHPRVNDPYILYTDACNYALGGILCQIDEQGIERPIQYLSAQFTSAQQKWATIEKEAYAVVYCLKKLRAYLLGSEFVVYTDHKPLLCLFTKEMVNTRIQRWAVLLAEYGAKIQYRQGKNNIRADMLSRITEHEVAVFDASEEWVTLEDENTGHAFLPSETHGLNDPEVKEAQKNEFPEEFELAADPENGKFLIYEGLLYSVSRPQANVAVYPRLLLPMKYRLDVIHSTHESTGHAGLAKMLHGIQEHYVWPGMRREVQKALDTCGICRVNNARQVHPPMGEMPIATCPGQIVGIDLMGPLFESSLHTCKYICVVIDHYSNWIEAYPLKNKSNEGIWERMANDYVPRHGAPQILISDQGSEFRGAGWEQWLETNHIEHRRTSGYNPQSNGKTERANGIVRRMLERLVNSDRAAWEDQLGPALTAIRNNVSTVTGYSPFMLHHARSARHAIGRMVDGTSHPTWSDRLQQQGEVMAKAARATAASRYYNRERLARKANSGQIEIGDQVMIKGQRITPLTAKWDHHFTVTQVRGKVITVLHEPTGKTSRWNRNKIRLVDPDVSWEGVRIRPKAQQVITNKTTSTFAGPRHPPLLPQHDETINIPVNHPRKRGAADPQAPLITNAKRPRWAPEQMDVLSFCAQYFQ